MGFLKNKLGQISNIMGGVAVIVTGIIGVVIVQSVISNTTFTGLTGTIIPYVPVFFVLGLLVASISIAVGYMRGQ